MSIKLPVPFWNDGQWYPPAEDAFNAVQMRVYAAAAVAEERKRCADLCRRPPGWLTADQLIIATEIQLAILKG